MKKTEKETYVMELIEASIKDEKCHEPYRCAKDLEKAIVRAISDYFLSKNHEYGFTHYVCAEDDFLDMLVSWRAERYEREKEGKPKEAIPDLIVDALFSCFDEGGYYGKTYVSGIKLKGGMEWD